MFLRLSRSWRVRGLLATVLVLVAVTGSMCWSDVYVAWRIRAARKALKFGGPDDVESALAMLRSARAMQRTSRPELLYVLGRAERRAGNITTAVEYLEHAQETGWPAEEVAQQIKLARMQRGDMGDSRRALADFLSQRVDDEVAYEVYEAMAKGYLFSFRFADAMQCLDFWIEWCPDAVEPRVMRAGIWERTENWNQAIEEYREVLRLKPAHQKARLSMAGIMLLQLNQVAEARSEFETCLKEAPTEIAAILGVAACQRRLGESADAERRLRQVLCGELTAEERKCTQLELGQILLDRRKPVEALQLLSKAAKADPRDSIAQYALGSAYAANGQSAQAEECFERSRALHEQFTRLTDITRQLVSSPDRPDLRWESGRILMDQGLHAEGAAWMSTALIYDPHHEKTHESLAIYYETVKPDPRMAAYHRGKIQAGIECATD